MRRLYVLFPAAILAGCGGDSSSPAGPPGTRPVASVQLSRDTATLVPQALLSLAVTLRDAGGAVLSNRAVSWTTSAASVATVASDGTVTAVVPGTANIVATSEGKSATARVTVLDGAVIGPAGGIAARGDSAVVVMVPAGAFADLRMVTIEPVASPTPHARLVAGSTYDVRASGAAFTQPAFIRMKYQQSALPSGGRPHRLAIFRLSGSTWQVIAGGTVDTAQRLVTAPASMAATYGIIERDAPVVHAITVTPPNVTITAGATRQLAALAEDEQGADLTDVELTWSSTAPGVATVTQAGQVTAVSPGTATIEAASGSVKGQSTITVTPNTLASTQRPVTIQLPPGAQIAPGALTVRTSLGEAGVSPSGTASLPALAGGPQLAAAFAPNGNLVLLGWLDAQQSQLSARSTAEVLAYFDLGGALLVPAARTFVMNNLRTNGELGTLAGAITTALSASPATVTADVPAVHTARRDLQGRLLPAAAIAARRASRGTTTGASAAIAIDPLAPKSGIIVAETDLNMVLVRNQFRRRAVALLDRISYVNAQGQTQPARLDIAKEDIPATFGVQSLGGALADVVLGNMAWAEVEIPPIPTPLFPSDARSTLYRLTVLGAGVVPAGTRQQLTPTESNELDLVVAKTVVLDLFLPLLLNYYLDGSVRGDAIEDALKLPGVTTVFADFVSFMSSTVPAVWTLAYAGDLRGAVNEIMTALGSMETFQEKVFEMAAVFAFAVTRNDYLSSQRLIVISEFGKLVMKFVGKVDAILTVTDACIQGWSVVASNGVERWDLNVLPTLVSLNPPQSGIGKFDTEVFTAVVHGANDLAPGAVLKYRWSTTGRHGTVDDARQWGTQFMSSSDTVTYTPSLTTAGFDSVTVEVSRVQAGTPSNPVRDSVVIGTATAAIEVRDLTIELLPEKISLNDGETHPFSVRVPATMSFPTMTYRWSTTGAFGHLDRGSKNYQSNSSSANYTARSQIDGDDRVTVEVFATVNGVTAWLGRASALVKVEKKKTILKGRWFTEVTPYMSGQFPRECSALIVAFTPVQGAKYYRVRGYGFYDPLFYRDKLEFTVFPPFPTYTDCHASGITGGLKGGEYVKAITGGNGPAGKTDLGQMVGRFTGMIIEVTVVY